MVLAEYRNAVEGDYGILYLSKTNAAARNLNAAVLLTLVALTLYNKSR